MRDFVLDGNDLAIADGDLAIGTVADDNAYLLLVTAKGDWKESPLTGIGAERFLNSPDGGLALEREVLLQMQADGFHVRGVRLGDNGTLNIDATWPEA